MLAVLIAYGALWAVLLVMIAWMLLAELGRRIESGRLLAGIAGGMRRLLTHPRPAAPVSLPRRGVARAG